MIRSKAFFICIIPASFLPFPVFKLMADYDLLSTRLSGIPAMVTFRLGIS